MEYIKIGKLFGYLIMKRRIAMSNIKSKYPTDHCWQTGNYTDDCECEFCEHKEECSGYERDDEDDD